MAVVTSTKHLDSGQETQVYLVYCDYCGILIGTEAQVDGPVDRDHRQHVQIKGWHRCTQCSQAEISL